MEQVLTDFSASISKLKKNPSELLHKSAGQPIAILNRNTPTAYLIAPELYERLLDVLDDRKLMKIVKERQKEYSQAIEISLNDL